MSDARQPVIVSAVRTAIGKAPRGQFSNTRPDELGAAVITAATERVPGLTLGDLDDVILGCAFPEGSQGMNVARIASLRAGVPHHVAAMTVNRFCSSGLQTIAQAADRIAAGNDEVILAGGTESMSQVPMGGASFLPNPALVIEHPDWYLGVGLTAERLVQQYDVSRADQDAFALRSHQRALAAQAAGRFRDEIVPVPVALAAAAGDDVVSREFVVDTDEGPRADSTLERLGALRPVFDTRGTVTAGNASQMSDGAGAAIVMSRARADALGAKPLAIFRGFAVAGVAPDVMGIGPVEAVPKLLARTGVSLDEIDLIELNEAFAAQALAVIRTLGLDEEKVNVNGGAVALGHPLGATGAKLTATLLHEMERRDARYGIVTMCVGGGMGAAGLFERV